MKRYLVFAGLDYEPSGGANDLVGSYETCAEALRNHAPLPSDWWGHVLDTHTGEVTQIPGQPTTPCGSTRIALMETRDLMPGVSCDVVFGGGDR